MRYLIMGDLHGGDLGPLETAMGQIAPDALICLSDFDQAKTIRQFLALQERMGTKPVVSVAGNHDLAVLDGTYIYSGSMARQGKSFWEFHDELHADSIARDYLHLLVHEMPFRVPLDIGGRHALVMHAALDGSLVSYPACPSAERDLWLRLLCEEDYLQNFAAMRAEGVDILIRGHDHAPKLASLNEKLRIEEPTAGSRYALGEGMHVINPGAWCDKWFATLDAGEVPVLHYRRL
ncbi:metallophosphoesterase family protein [Candidatus Woesearchaeota archaeon]|nr:metallophosphoesterase family protein [Candidatus Woesearchaeota archaeon]